MGKGIVLGCLLFFCGVCTAPGGGKPHPVVTQIEMVTQAPGAEESYVFSTDEQTTPVLLYLRRLEAYDPAPVNPEYVDGPMVSFTLRLSDGSSRHLRLKDGRYFQGRDGVWRCVEGHNEDLLLQAIAYSQADPGPLQ
ncbi:MAG: hypothetical protein IJN53_01270 [Oscillospiraceae bacterium]|nr:hypothetical protein [Oscillospiraceae bacterium]